MRRSFLSSLALVGVALSHPLSAQQQPPEIAPNQRIRISQEVEGGYRRVAGTVLEVSGDTMLLEVHGNQEKVALSSVHTLAVSRGRGSRVRYGAWGAGIGAAVGTGLGFYLRENSSGREVQRYRDRCIDPNDPSTCVREWYRAEEDTPVFQVVGVSVVGSALGALVGALLPGDRWETVPLQLAPTVGARTGVSVSVSLSR